MREYTADAGAFLQQVSGPAALFRHSLGGVIVVITAAICPREVRAQLVGDAPLDAVTWLETMQGQRETQQHWRELSGGKYTDDEIIIGLSHVLFIRDLEWVANEMLKFLVQITYP